MVTLIPATGRSDRDTHSWSGGRNRLTRPATPEIQCFLVTSRSTAFGLVTFLLVQLYMLSIA